MKQDQGTPIRLLLVDDHPIVLSGLRNSLANHPQFLIVGEASNGLEAISQARQVHPDVVLMDITLPRKNGLEATKEIQRLIPGTRVLILTIHENKEYALEVIKAGAMGYVLKDSSPADLLKAIETVYRGESFFSPSIAQMLVNELRDSMRRSTRRKNAALTGREEEVLALIAEGLSNPAIAQRLNLSVRTAEKHRQNIMRKLGLTNVAELTKYALRHGIIPQK